MLIYKEKNYPKDLINYIKNIFSISFKLKLIDNFKSIINTRDTFLIFENFYNFELFNQIQKIKNKKILILTEYFGKCDSTGFQTLNLEKKLNYISILIISLIIFFKKNYIFKYKYHLIFVFCIFLLIFKLTNLLILLILCFVLHKIFKPFLSIINYYNHLAVNRIRYECTKSMIQDSAYVISLSEDIFPTLKKVDKNLYKKNKHKFLFLDLFSEIKEINYKQYKGKLKKLHFSGYLNSYREQILRKKFSNIKFKKKYKFIKYNKKYLFSLWIKKYSYQKYSPGSIVALINYGFIPILYPRSKKYFFSYNSSSQIQELIDKKFNFKYFKEKILILKKNAITNNRKIINKLKINET